MLQRFARKASADELAKFFGVGGAHLERAVETARLGFVGAPGLLAGDRYSGVVWEHLGLSALQPADRRWCAKHIVVVSGLMGFVMVGDPVPDYRLKMGARLPQLGALAQWWKPKLREAAREVLACAEVVDLLPNEHAAAFDPMIVAQRTTRVRFMSATGASAAGHAAKAAKGLIARAIVEGRSVATESVCSTTSLPGFTFDELVVECKRPSVRVVRLRAESTAVRIAV